MPVGRDRARELFKAAKTGDVNAIERLLGTRKKGGGSVRKGPKGPSANVQDDSGLTPLHYAAMNGFNDAVQLILLGGASAHIADNSGSYPIHLAAWKGDIEVARTLIERGPSQANVDAQSHCEETALHLAAQYGHREVVEYLLEQKADAYVRNNKKETALDLAAQFGHVEVVNLLVRFHPALLSVEFTSTSPLHLASRNGHVSVVLALITAGLGVNTLCDCGTALHEAALFGKSEVVKVLMQKGVNITLVDKNGRTVFDVLDQYPTKRSQDIKDIIVGTSQTADGQLPSEMGGDDSHDNDDGISSVNNPVYDSAANALGEDGLELLRIPLSDRFNHLPKQTVCAVARVDYHDSIHGDALRLRLGDRIRVIGQNSNGTWVGLLGGAEGSFFASHVDFYEVVRGRDVQIGSDDIQVTQLQMPHEDSDQEAPPLPPHASSAPTSVLEAFNADNIAALRSCSSYAQLNPVLKGEEEGLPHMRFVLQDEAVVGPQHSYSEVALVKQPPRSGAAGHSSSRSGLPLQEAMRFAPAMSKKEEEKAAHPYFNLSRGIHHYQNFDQTKKTDADDYIRLPQMVANEEARKALNRSPCQRALDEEEKAFMRDTWEDVAEEDTPPSESRSQMKLSLGDLENDLLMKEIKRDEDDQDRNMFDSGDSVRPEAQTPEMGNVLRGRDPFTPKESHGYSRKKFKSDLLRKSELSVRPRSYEERNGRASPVYDPNPPRCYEWSKLKHPPPSDPLLRPVVPPPRQLHQPNAGNGPSEAPHVYENVVVKPIPRPRSKPPPHPPSSGEQGPRRDQIDMTRMQLGMINYENVSTIVDSMTHKSGDPAASNQENGLTKVPKTAQSPVKPRRDFAHRPFSQPSYENVVLQKRRNSGPGDSVVIHNDLDPFIGLVLASRSFTPAERKSKLYSVWTEKKDRDAWEQVDSVMGVVEKSLTDLSEEMSQGKDSVSMLEWLTLLGLAGYAEVLQTHGYDHLEYMGEGMLDAEDLVEMRVVDPEAQSTLLAAVSLLPPPPDSAYMPDVQSWLKVLRLDHLYPYLIANGYGSLERVVHLTPWKLQLEEVVQGQPPPLLLGHQKRLTYAIAQLGMAHPEWVEQLSPGTRRLSLNFPLKGSAESVLELSGGLSKSLEDVFLQQDYTDLKALPSTKQREKEREEKSTTTSELEEDWSVESPSPSPSYLRKEHRRVSSVAIRPPKLAQADAGHLIEEVLQTELLVDNAGSAGRLDSRDQWKHTVDTLLNRRLEYSVMYLGSLLLKSQKLAAEEAVAKLKAMNESQPIIPEVILSISWTGVKYFSNSTGRPISDHSIQHIYYCSQDRSDEQILSYITKDCGLIFCHVFRTPSKETTLDIVMTIGQAFEVAYQKIQRARLKVSGGKVMQQKETELHQTRT